MLGLRVGDGEGARGGRTCKGSVGMSILAKRRGLAALALAGAALMMPLAVGAQETEAPAAAAPATVDAPPPPAQSAFQVSEELEAMRYRHLWIAYGVIWLFVFGFVWRNWKLERATSRELAALEARIGDLEGGAGVKADG